MRNKIVRERRFLIQCIVILPPSILFLSFFGIGFLTGLAPIVLIFIFLLLVITSIFEISNLNYDLSTGKTRLINGTVHKKKVEPWVGYYYLKFDETDLKELLEFQENENLGVKGQYRNKVSSLKEASKSIFKVTINKKEWFSISLRDYLTIEEGKNIKISSWLKIQSSF